MILLFTQYFAVEMQYRAERIVREYGEREESPEQRLKDKDKRRAAYHRFYTNMKWGHAQNYHLTLDSGVLGIDKCEEVIAGMYKSMKPLPEPKPVPGEVFLICQTA